MAKLFKKVLFGYKPDDVNAEIEKIQAEKQNQIKESQTLREEAELQIKKQEEIISELKKKIEEFNEREHAISEVMISAQKNAQIVQEEAMQKAQTMLKESEEKVRLKTQELESLRTRVNNFKEEFHNVLEKYQSSLETMEVERVEQFKPTVIISNK